ncbi:MAG: sigma-70 family RNA polymerase sigma factor [Bryobacterales bacterium]|nr:sigma-70 family RNA polymerase sigma factor [Bryobacterales bacterium]
MIAKLLWHLPGSESFMARTDSEIQQLLRAGRVEEAFEAIVYAYQHRIYRLALAMTGDPGLAEDAAQETLLRLWRHMGSFRGESQLGTWIYTVCRNRCLTLMERRANRREDPADVLAARPAPAAPSDYSDLLAALQALDAPQREAVTLFYLEEQSYEDVSRHMGVPLGTVKTWLHRARKALADWFADRGIVEKGER